MLQFVTFVFFCSYVSPVIDTSARSTHGCYREALFKMKNCTGSALPSWFRYTCISTQAWFKNIYYFIFISGYNSATHLSLGDIIEWRIRGKKGVKFSSVWSVQRFRLGVVFNKLRWATYDALCYINLQCLMFHVIFQQLSFIEFPA